MLRHIIIAAWRNMTANKLISAIAILGLAVGIAAALLMAAVIRNQLSFDHFIAGYQRTYLVLSRPISITEQVRAQRACEKILWSCYMTETKAAALLKLNVPEIESVTRLSPNGDVSFRATPVKVTHGNAAGWENIFWADPNFFDILQMPVLYGDLATALARPDGIVLPRALAEKYFGRDNIVGSIVKVNGRPMTVRAVIRDIPPNASEFESGLFASALSSSSKLAAVPGTIADQLSRGLSLQVATYVRLKPGASVASVEAQATRLLGTKADKSIGRDGTTIGLFRLDRIGLDELTNPGARSRVTVAGLAGLLVLFIALVNFVNLMTAQAARREKEVGVRKTCGADRPALIVQFMGEAMLAVIMAGVIAVAAGEWLMPVVNAFLRTGARFDYFGDPSLPFLLLIGIIASGLLASAWPAFVLSAFKPASTLKGWASATGASLIRKLLVMLQFAILVVLAICAVVIWQQHGFATREATRMDADQVLLVRLTLPGGPRGPANMQAPGSCPAAFTDQVRKLPGVQDVRCSASSILTANSGLSWYTNGHRSIDNIGAYQVDPGIFALYGIKPLAGSLADRSGVVINLAAAKKLGFASPQAALGKNWIMAADMAPGQAADFIEYNGGHDVITAVVPDFSFMPVTSAVRPAMFSPWMHGISDRAIHIKLSGAQIPETLAAIDRIWAATNQPGPIDRIFVSDYMEQLYQDMTREAQFLSAFAVIAILLACLGLFGIAVSTAERRTKEIGIRKAMGAGNGQIVTLLLWQFAQPVLWANVIAWPVAWWLMRRWLSGFAYHIDLHLWVFAAVSLGALAIALATVAGQAFLTARQKPVLALRYE
jgi:putative ABC transport system permease protein